MKRGRTCGESGRLSFCTVLYQGKSIESFRVARISWGGFGFSSSLICYFSDQPGRPRPTGACTIFGGGSIGKIDANAGAARMILEASNGNIRQYGDVRDLEVVREARLEADEELALDLRNILANGLTSASPVLSRVGTYSRRQCLISHEIVSLDPNFIRPGLHSSRESLLEEI